jgi:N-acyl homoserine lactone hydrolase
MTAYSIWVLEYGYVPEFPAGSLIYGAHGQPPRKLAYCYVLIKGQGHVALVDVGFNYKDYGKVLADVYGAHKWQPPQVVLAECGVTPADVDTVFLTHAHFDHMGNIPEFPNAKFYIQERELSKWVWAMSIESRFRWLTLGLDPADIMHAVDLARQGRLVCVDGDRQDVLPGIDLHAAFNSHTWGSMWVHVRNSLTANSADNWVLAGDLVYTFENLRGDNPADPCYTPIGFASGSQVNLIMATDAMVKAVGGDISRVIPVHEDRLKDVFPSRLTKDGLRIVELSLADGETSRV